MSRSVILVILALILLIVLYCIYRKNFKHITLGAVNLVTGGVKTGKSLLSCELSIKEYKRRHRQWWFKSKVLKRRVEEPLFYTNVLISFGSIYSKKPHRLDKNIRLIELSTLLRETRFAFKSVVYIQESSLLADSMDFNDKERNVELSLFNKLFGHSTHGGCLIYDTQSVMDNHYSAKRVLSSYYFIQKNKNFGLFRVLYIRELVNNEMLTSSVNNFDSDVDFSTRMYLVWRWYYKKYDCYYYSYLTDGLNVSNEHFKSGRGLVSFNPLYNKIANGEKYQDLKKKKKEVKENDKTNDTNSVNE